MNERGKKSGNKEGRSKREWEGKKIEIREKKN